VSPPAPAPPKLKTRFFEGLGRTPEEEQGLQELSRAIEAYEAESKEFRKEVQLLVEKKYDEKRSALANSYEKAIRDLEIVERKERLDAIAQFEEFLKRYPEDQRYTPDVMFRLAELYYERSSDDQLLAQREYEEKLKAQDPSKGGEPPAEPQVDFSKSIALYRKLIAQFPDYRLNDGAYYLLGYCLEKQNDFEQSRETYQQLIARYPKSKFTTEAWVRIGEYWFDDGGGEPSLRKAAAAYAEAISDKTHPLYDKALYKLGWTYYRLDDYASAVDRFLDLADFYAAQAKAKGEEEVGGDLRNESLQYAAISFSDETWGGLARADEVLTRRGHPEYEAEIYRRLGKVYFDQTKHADAVEAFRRVLAKDPTAKDAPQIQEQIVKAYERDRKMDDSNREAQVLADKYGPGSEWYEKYKRDPEVVAAAQELAERNLYSAAIYHHQQAQVFKQEGKAEEAKAAFEAAAKAYGNYLTRYPRSKNGYEIQYYYADCLFYSLQYQEAGKNYEVIRDSAEDKRYQKNAAEGSVFAWQFLLDQEVRAGKLPDLKVVLSAERKEGEEVKPLPLAEVEQRLVSASDAFLKLQPQDEKAPTTAYKAAELFYKHNDFPEARRRFEEIVKTYPQNEVAKFATNLIVESFLAIKDWKSVEEVAGRLAANKDTIDPKSDLYKNLVKFKLGGRFNLATELMEKGDYENAAKKFIELVNEEPKHEFADKALNNAAVCYERSLRFESATQLYERVFREYPSSKLADAALFRVAVNAENSYDFDKAVTNYQKLVKDYPASKDRESALFNTARLLEVLQRYPEAAAAFLRYADLYPNTEDAPKNQFRAALIYEKRGDWKGEIRALDEFVTKFSSKATQADLVVDAKKRIGDAWQKLGNEREATKAYEAASAEFDKRGLKAEKNEVAAAAAAIARFQLAEYQLKEFDKLKIGGSGKVLEKSFTTKRSEAKKVNQSYETVFKYKQLEWTLAALYRQGNVLEHFATTIVETPVPPDIKRLGDEGVVAYQDLLAQQTTTYEDAAVDRYTTTLAEARKNHISNEWTKKTLESLNRFRPKEFPVLKDPKGEFASEAVYPEGLVGSLEGAVKVEAAPQKLGDGGEK